MLKAFGHIKRVVKSNFFRKWLILKDKCVTYSELPSYISTMGFSIPGIPVQCGVCVFRGFSSAAAYSHWSHGCISSFYCISRFWKNRLLSKKNHKNSLKRYIHMYRNIKVNIWYMFCKLSFKIWVSSISILLGLVDL